VMLNRSCKYGGVGERAEGGEGWGMGGGRRGMYILFIGIRTLFGEGWGR
jgi:hypothetical protein